MASNIQMQPVNLQRPDAPADVPVTSLRTSIRRRVLLGLTIAAAMAVFTFVVVFVMLADTTVLTVKDAEVQHMRFNFHKMKRDTVAMDGNLTLRYSLQNMGKLRAYPDSAGFAITAHVLPDLPISSFAFVVSENEQLVFLSFEPYETRIPEEKLSRFWKTLDFPIFLKLQGSFRWHLKSAWIHTSRNATLQCNYVYMQNDASSFYGNCLTP